MWYIYQFEPSNKGEEFKVDYLEALPRNYEAWNFNSGNYLFTTDTK